MFNENQITENRVCFNSGRVEELRDILFDMELNDRKTIRFSELEKRFTDRQKMYEASWNIWADKNHIGGSRYTCEGKAEKK